MQSCKRLADHLGFSSDRTNKWPGALSQQGPKRGNQRSMASNYTENYKLPLWEGGDSFVREEFNAANKTIDSALGALAQSVSENAKLHFGTYVGNDETMRDIALGFTPKIVMLWTAHGLQFNTEYGTAYGGTAGQGYPCKLNGVTCIELTESGFLVFCNIENKVCTNYKSIVYYYIAVE